ncbi:MAG: undecaprenyldiphospho-muramoylpentapeptide beta-N-acetylglucosaminyltransferase [Candidatus Omnitrophota bacterium]
MGHKNKKIILATGGTGGHVFPAVAVYQRLKKIEPAAEVIFIISGRSTDKRILDSYGYNYKVLSALPLPAKFAFKNIIKFVSAFFRSIRETFIIFKSYKPDLIVGFGCYISAPVVLTAFLKRKRIILHEQNVLPSKTNLFLRRFADLVILSFDETGKFFPKNDTFVAGNPLREQLKILDKEEAFNRLGAKRADFNILVVGGSQGAKKLNEIVPQSIALMDNDEKSKISVLHLAGPDTETVKELYQNAEVKAEVKDFLNEMETALSACDLAIARSGALTLSELAFFGLPAVLIPYAYDSGFQLSNAKHYAKKKAAFVLEEKDMDVFKLKELIENIMRDKELFSAMKGGMRSLRKASAAEQISDIILNYKG